MFDGRNYEEIMVRLALLSAWYYQTTYFSSKRFLSRPFPKAMRFSLTMPLSLPKRAAEISNYALSKDSILSERDVKIRNLKEKEFARTLREIRLLCRTVAAKANTQKTQVSRTIELLCKEAIKLSEDLKDEEKNHNIIEVVNSLVTKGYIPKRITTSF